MFLVGILSWWYTGGLFGRIKETKDRFESTLDFFSFDLLISTLFTPYRQISAGGTDSLVISDRFRAAADNLISRTIGAIVRTFMIIIGALAITIQLFFNIIMIIFWLFAPAIPIVGLIMTTIGWTL